jgi:hypothetical protein
VKYAVVAALAAIAAIGIWWRGQARREAIEVVRADLFDPESARFTDVAAHTIDGVVHVCGTVNGKNRLGAYVGRTRFIAMGTYVLMENDGVARSFFEDRWQRECPGQ